MGKLFFAFFAFFAFAFAQVDINSADETQLATLKGVGPKKAKDIVEYRKQKCFDNIGELEKVKGFGAKSVEKLKNDIVAKPCKKIELKK